MHEYVVSIEDEKIVDRFFHGREVPSSKLALHEIRFSDDPPDELDRKLKEARVELSYYHLGPSK